MKIAVVTGASSGLGAEFLYAMHEFFPEIEEYWLIARRREKMEEISSKLSVKCKILPLDLTLDESYSEYKAALEESGAEVALLINNSGCGYLGNVGDGELDRQIRMIDLNLKGLTAVTHLTIPHMKNGGRVINISSIASFCPNSRMTVYSSTKAYVTSFSFGIGEELKSRKIKVTAVCPGPMDTEFIYLGEIKGQSKTFDTLPYCDAKKVARGALKAAKKGKSVYTPRAFYKFYRVLAKLLPAKLVMQFSKT